jgi:hypothetical protein
VTEHTIQSLAKSLGVNRSTVYRWWRKGTIVPTRIAQIKGVDFVTPYFSDETLQERKAYVTSLDEVYPDHRIRSSSIKRRESQNG